MIKSVKLLLLLLIIYVLIIPINADCPTDEVIISGDGIVTTDAGQSSILRLDSKDNPGIAYTIYWDTEPSWGIGYAYKNYTDEWTNETIFFAGVENNDLLGFDYDSDDNPHITFANKTYSILYHIYKNGGSWELENVTGSNYGKYSDVSIGDDDEIHVSYFNSSAKTLWHANKTVGGGWRNEQVDLTSAVSNFDSRITVDNLDRLHIVYPDWGGATKYAYKPSEHTMTNLDFETGTYSGWNRTGGGVIETFGGSGEYIAQRSGFVSSNYYLRQDFGSPNVTSISFDYERVHDTDRELMVYYYDGDPGERITVPDRYVWHRYIHNFTAGTDTSNYYVKISVGGSGYYDYYLDNFAVSTWTIENITTSDKFVDGADIVVDDTGGVHIIRQNKVKTFFEYSYKEIGGEDGWVNATVGANTSSWDSAAIAIDSSNNPYIAWGDVGGDWFMHLYQQQVDLSWDEICVLSSETDLMTKCGLDIGDDGYIHGSNYASAWDDDLGKWVYQLVYFTNDIGTVPPTPTPTPTICETCGVTPQQEPQLVASFERTPNIGECPITVTFTDVSIGGALNRTWNFGDGTIENTTESTISHTYYAPGKYSVELTVSDGVRSNAASRYNSVYVTGAIVPNPTTTFGVIGEELQYAQYNLTEYAQYLPMAYMGNFSVDASNAWFYFWGFVFAFIFLAIFIRVGDVSLIMLFALLAAGTILAVIPSDFRMIGQGLLILAIAAAIYILIKGRFK